MGEIFNGTWTLDLGASTIWDDRTRTQVPDKVGQEIITIRSDVAVQDYEVHRSSAVSITAPRCRT